MAKISLTEKWKDDVKKHMDTLSYDEKRDFAYSIIFELALWAGYNTFEMVGILECVKLDLLQTSYNIDNEED